MMDRNEIDAAFPKMLEAARVAGRGLMEGYRKRPAASQKAKNDLLTEFDIRSEETIVRQLEVLGLPIIAEENHKATVDDTQARLYIDPLDGTMNFVHGHFFFAVSIGLWEAGKCRAGVVFAPALSTAWWATEGGGAYRNGWKLAVSENADFSEGLFASGFPADRSTAPKNNFGRFLEVKRQTRGVRRCGSASIDLALVADGTYDGYWEAHLHPWDYCAGVALVEEAGGRVTAYDGSEADIRNGALVATNGHVHDALIGALANAKELL